jgi:hypothetical protein
MPNWWRLSVRERNDPFCLGTNNIFGGGGRVATLPGGSLNDCF